MAASLASAFLGTGACRTWLVGHSANRELMCLIHMVVESRADAPALQAQAIDFGANIKFRALSNPIANLCARQNGQARQAMVRVVERSALGRQPTRARVTRKEANWATFSDGAPVGPLVNENVPLKKSA
jgi:hypothetical protein